VRIGALLMDATIAAQSRNRAGTWGAYYGTDSTAQQRVRGASALTGAYAREARLLSTNENLQALNDALAGVESKARRRATFGDELATADRIADANLRRWIALGKWLEAARIASRRGDRGFFEEPAGRVLVTQALQSGRRTVRQRACLALVATGLSETSATGAVPREALLTLALHRLGDGGTQRPLR
jgi:hypothetical protein